MHKLGSDSASVHHNNPAIAPDWREEFAETRSSLPAAKIVSSSNTQRHGPGSLPAEAASLYRYHGMLMVKMR